MDSRSLICWSVPPLTTKVGLNSPQYLINMHMGHYGPNSKLGRMSHTPPSKEPICWSVPHLTIKVGLNSPQYLINLHMGHYGPNSKLGRMSHTASSKEPTSSLAQHTHNRANDDQECSLFAHATVRPVPAHVPCRAPRRAYTRNEPPCSRP